MPFHWCGGRVQLEVDSRLAGVLGWLAGTPLPKKTSRKRRFVGLPDLNSLRLGPAGPAQHSSDPVGHSDSIMEVFVLSRNFLCVCAVANAVVQARARTRPVSRACRVRGCPRLCACV